MGKVENKPLTRLTDLEVSEVSLVDRGAIGEVFTVIKSEDENPDLVNKLKDQAGICDQLQKMTDVEFVKVMGQMMNRYNSINHNVNKGGCEEMGEEQIKSLVAEVVASAMDTVNKNFVAVNKSIDEIQKRVGCAESDEEKKKAEEAKTKAAKEEEVTKAVTSIGDAVKGLGEAVSSISKTLEGVTSQVAKISEMKLDEAVAAVSKRIENIEKQENPSNGVGSGEEVMKSAGEKKTVFWKSFLAAPEE